MKRLLFCCAALLIAAPEAQAEPFSCGLPTPKMAGVNYPGARAIPPSNDLTRYNGKAIAADGQRLILSAQLRDRDCIPIKDAVVELWQLNPYGKWRLATPEDLVNPNPVFSGAGRTYTDNNGNFMFTTLFPAPVKDMAPRLYLRILPPDMPEFTTILYFSGDVRNGTDVAYRKLSLENRPRVELAVSPINNDPNQGLIAATQIILPGKAPYRSY